MTRGREEKIHETSLSPSPLCHRRISTRNINIPLDLTVEILKKLPAKSLVRFKCVSKCWSSIISSRKDFIESIVTRSLTQPPRDAHLIEDLYDKTDECLLVISSPCPQMTHKESVSILGTDHEYARGLFLCWSYEHQEGAIYNPTTRQSFNLPKMKHSHPGLCFFGYEPLENQYKVLFIPNPVHRVEQACQVFTLGDTKAEEQWRNIQNIEYLYPSLSYRSTVSINGAIYFLSRFKVNDTTTEYKILRFDIRSEKFYNVDLPKTVTLKDLCWYYLINYQGKLGLICCQQRMEIWIMEEDAEKKTQRWSKIFFYEMGGFGNWLISDVTRAGEIVFINKPLDTLRICYYDPKRNSVRYVDLKDSYPKERGWDKSLLIRTFPDYAENTMCLY
ncbi:hypothetical protein Bca4012_032446 [Brassica carinata]|uniref:F-box domain-containing protein n=1 Tax=Brassica napus TaxID=3708 RepID=A0ABQ7X1G3_BRANA|nr:probable F-box protein At3g56670 [Brassica napus]XP_048630672.1 probable F-box protein At3g56670 [Brassica napus]KAH0848997.1 hypothetical protein HID58_091606 [Brassica napus]